MKYIYIPSGCDLERASMMQSEPSDLRGITERGEWKAVVLVAVAVVLVVVSPKRA